MIMFFIILKLRSKREKKKGKQTGIKEALAKILTNIKKDMATVKDNNNSENLIC
jgi:hypothetical protein